MIGIVSLLTGSCLLWIPVIGWILAPLFLIAAPVLWIVALLPSGFVMFRCENCNNFFKVPKAELEA